MSHKVLALGLTVLLFVTETSEGAIAASESVGSYGTGNGQFIIRLEWRRTRQATSGFPTLGTTALKSSTQREHILPSSEAWRRRRTIPGRTRRGRKRGWR